MARENPKPAHKERGCWLTGMLILIIIHGIFASLLIFYLRRQPYADTALWQAILVLLAIADIVAAIAIWYWKRWGFVLYAISTAIGIAIGLVLTASQLVVFHDIVPLAILGYLVKDIRDYFD
jgi:hypothetical protein